MIWMLDASLAVGADFLNGGQSAGLVGKQEHLVGDRVYRIVRLLRRLHHFPHGLLSIVLQTDAHQLSYEVADPVGSVHALHLASSPCEIPLVVRDVVLPALFARPETQCSQR